MFSIVSLLVLALALSLDGFGVGVMYGLRKIRIPFVSVMIISCCSGVMIFLAMQIGVVLSRFLPPGAARTIGGIILIGIGLWAVIQMLRQIHKGQEPLPAPDQAAAEPDPKKVVQIELKRLGLVIQILRTPSMADVDRSGVISPYEATLLGISLSLDAFGAGIGAALIGFAPWLTALAIAFASGTFITAGLKVGIVFSDIDWVKRFSVLPGCVLIMIGLLKLFH